MFIFFYSITKIIISLYRLNCRFEQAEERINELEKKAFEIIQFKDWGGGMDIIKNNKIHIVQVTERERK